MYHIIKRLIDLFLSGLALCILSPLLIPVMVILRLTGEGEVFYVQERIGFHNVTFGALKFATMVKNSLNIGSGSITLPGDSRVLPFGHFLRKTKINELPQLLNVLKGEMSLVGPRPLVTATFEAYSPLQQAQIYKAKPGLTGIGSVVFRDEERLFENSEKSPAEFYRESIAPHKGDLELWYQDNRTTVTDLKIIVLTVWVIGFPNSDLAARMFPTMPKRDWSA